ncbi:MAG TPA: hypothetical protein P5204_02900 [Kiritimatiellia bacterium]|nr:hypothetical protein [Kiritimatiellia bacterium]
MKRNLALGRWLPLVLLVHAGCTTARMAVPADLEARSDAYPCAGRGGFTLTEKFSFGPYEVAGVKRGWTHRVAWGIAMYERSRARQQYEFALRAPSGQTWRGQAATGVRKQDLKDAVAGGELTWGLTREVNFVARLGREGQPSAWNLALAEERGGVLLNGTLTDGRTAYRVEGSRQLAGTPIPLMENAGFLIYDGTRLVAAVDLVNAGSVRFDQALSPAQREPLAAAAAALLLYRDISQD